MVLKKLKDMRKNLSVERSITPGEEEYIEVDVGGSMGTAPAGRGGRMGIVIENISEFGDTEKVLKALREGHIVLLKVKSLKEKDLGELKRAVEKLKRTVLAQNGDIVGVEQDWLLLVPETVFVHR
jgi:SepF-like predicted cell division protein (DUF552 family)